MDYKIQYRKGTYNGTDDALSRKLVYSDAAVADSSCCAMSCAQPTWLQEVLVSYDADPYAQQLLTRLAVDNSTEQDFCLHNSIGTKVECGLVLIRPCNRSCCLPFTHQP
jgi:hypothetical protein